jgi:ribosomal protein L25 (general stress protein Ctc)
MSMPASERDTTLNPRQLRAAGWIPVTLYGKDFPSFNAQIKAHEFDIAYNQGQRDFELTGLGAKVVVKAHQVQRHSVSQETQNIEFLVLSADKALTNTVDASSTTTKEAACAIA